MIIQFKKPKEWQNKYNESSRNNILKLRMKLKKWVPQKELSKPKVGSFKKKKNKGLLKRKFPRVTHQGKIKRWGEKK